MPGSTGQPTMGWFPWVGYKSVVGAWQRENISAYLGMGHADNGPSANQNDEINWGVYLDKVTWKVACLVVTDTSRPIYTISFDGTTIGAIDTYGATNIANVYAEITGFTNATPKAGDLKVKYATKNASSTGFVGRFHSIALIATSQVGASTPAGTDTPGYTVEIMPFMGSKANTTFDTRVQASTVLSGGQVQSTGAQNSEISWDIWQDTGTFKFALIRTKNDDEGIAHIQLDGVDKGTLDGYNAGALLNSYAEAGITNATAAVKTFTVKMATKNASATGYYGRLHSTKWIRTGA